MLAASGVRPTGRHHLVDPGANAQLARDGFVVLDRRLDHDRVAELADLYERVVDEVGRDGSGRFRPSMMIADRDARARLWDGVGRLVGPVVDPCFEPGTTRVFGGSFVSKPASPHSERGPHQDPSVFDESVHASVSVWVPLIDSHEGNGALRLLPGSHLMGNHVRPPDVASFDAEVLAVAEAEAVTVELEAGQMLVIDGAVIHDSPPNRSDRERVAAIAALRTGSARMRIVRSEAGAVRGTAEVYEVADEAYRSGDLIDPDLAGASLVERAPYRPADLPALRASRRG